MAQTTTEILFPQTAYSSNNNLIRGAKKAAAAYYLGNADLQTVTWSLTSVTGLITIQATLTTNPVETTDTDWFTVYQFNCDNLTQNGYTNINGNFVWIRAKIAGFTQGVIQNMKVSY
jgi:hypothetical protein